jgi:lipopolysaccharide transport system ATP-binding protein
MEIRGSFMSYPVITFDNVSKSYPLYHHITGGFKHFLFNLPKALHSLKNSQFESLKDISFQISKGEAVGIIGKNGAGKSTTLGLIAGVLMPSQGRVFTRGRISPLLELGGGFHPELTGRENILLNGVLMGLTKKQVMSKMDDIIAFSELGDFIEQPKRVYSTGMIARLGFSVVAFLDPEILLIDEILAVGDTQFQNKCNEKIAEFKASGVTIVLVSHSMDAIRKICDKVIWIENHTIKMIGEPEEIAEQYLGCAMEKAVAGVG